MLRCYNEQSESIAGFTRISHYKWMGTLVSRVIQDWILQKPNLNITEQSAFILIRPNKRARRSLDWFGSWLAVFFLTQSAIKWWLAPLIFSCFVQVLNCAGAPIPKLSAWDQNDYQREGYSSKIKLHLMVDETFSKRHKIEESDESTQLPQWVIELSRNWCNTSLLARLSYIFGSISMIICLY